MSTGRLLLVSPRAPRRDGRGDQRRAWEILQALSEDWDVEVVSWLPDLDLPRRSRLVEKPVGLARTAALAVVRPLTVAYVQGHMPRAARHRLAAAAGPLGADGAVDVIVFVTHRAVPRRLPDRSVIDYIDDLGASSLVRAAATPGLRGVFWRVEGRRIQRLDRRLAADAAVTVAHSSADASAISSRVRTIPLSRGTSPTPDDGTLVVFAGNLFYGPNHEAAMWICTDLVPALAERGIGPERVVVAGRAPRDPVRQAAAAAGIDLRADVPDLAAVYDEAAVVIAPMALGVGALYKTIDAVGAGRACVLSPVANQGLGLVDGESALVADRQPGPFAEAVASLLADPALRGRLVARALAALDDNRPDMVAHRWRAAARDAASPVAAPQPAARRAPVVGDG